VPTSSTNSWLRFRVCFGSLFLFSIVLAGCEKQESISSYTVATHDSLQTLEFRNQLAAQRTHEDAQTAHEQQMLGAIIEKGPAMWFFKLQGRVEPVAAHEPEFREFLKTIRFPNPERIEWELPDKWQEKPPSGIRYATLVIPGEPPLEISVTTFPTQGGTATERLLENVNRWRGQLSLPAIKVEEIPTSTERIQLGDVVATYVNLTGKAKPQGAMSGAPSGRMSEPAKTRPMEGPRKEPAQMKYDKPEGWNDAPLVPKSQVTFEARDGERVVTISITRAGGSLAANLNRWRGQVGLNPLPDDELAKSLTKLPIGARTGEFAELTGTDPSSGKEKTILGVIIPDGEATVFVKLSGDPELAARERSRFEAFAKSLKF